MKSSKAHRATIYRNFARLAFISMVLFLSVSCEDLLEEKSYSKLTSANFYKDADAAVAAVNACYRTLCGWGTLGYHGHKMIELASDISDGTNEALFYAEAKYDASSESVRFGWIGWYTTIHNCNAVLERIGEIDMDETLKLRIYGEAKFLRAWSNFQLVQLYGDIPLRYESAKTPEFISIPRTPVAKVYDLIIEDLKFAEENLWDEYVGNDKGRVNVAAAKTLLASVYLTMGGYPLNMGEEMFTLARDKAKEVIDERGGLPVPEGELSGYADLYKLDYQSKYHKEKLFFINHANVQDQGTPLTSLYAPTNDYGPSTSASFWHTNEFYNSFEPNDDRAITGFHHLYTSDDGSKTYYWPDTTGNNGLIPGLNVPPPAGATLGLHPFSTKYDDPSATTKTNSASPINVLRYAETLLIFAEAENEINGPSQAAFDAINGVRSRAKIPDLQLVMNNQNDQVEFREKVLIERAHEFFGENKRRFDLIRTGKFIETMNAVGRTVTTVHLLFPIPLEEILGNTAINQENQNPGW